MKRLSGGRGEYEVAENHGATVATDLIGHELRLSSMLFGTRDTGVTTQRQGGKPRLRLDGRGIQLHRQVAALALLPKPIRDETQVGIGRPIVREGAYIIRRMFVDDILLTTSTADLALGKIEL